ncbi:MAG: TonB family protein [Bacteroidales bacterium]|jgi:TonB family protein|nr:TonB family protein [Bacteroidales bacterium]
MGAFVTYVLKAGIFLLFFYLFNRLFLARETFIIPISLMLPFCIPEFFNPFTWFGGQPAQNNEGAVGRLLVSYVLSEEGTITQVKILRGVHPSIDAEVMRVVKSSPRWEKPAMKESVPITVSYVIPMVFTLNGYNRDSSKISKELKDLKDQKVLDEITVVSYP